MTNEPFVLTTCRSQERQDLSFLGFGKAYCLSLNYLVIGIDLWTTGTLYKIDPQNYSYERILIFLHFFRDGEEG